MNRFLGWSTLSAMAACHIAGLLFLPLMPLVMGALATAFNTSSIGLGTVASVQLGATAVGAFLFSKLGARLDCRNLVLCAILVELLVNIASALSDSLSSITLLRALAGLAEGMLLAGASATAAMSRRTERVFVVYNVGLAMFAVLGLLVGSRMILQHGYAAGFLLFAAVDLLALGVIVRGFPACEIQSARHATARVPVAPAPRNSGALLAMIFYGAALAGTQTFLERRGVAHGGSFNAIGNALAAGWCLAVVSPFMVFPMLRQWGGVTSLAVAYLFVTVVAVALSVATSLPVYLVAAALFTPTVLLIAPLQFGLLGAMDRTGHLAALGPAAISIGSGIGPIVTGFIVGFLGLKSAGFFAGILLLLSGMVLIPLAARIYQPGARR